MPLPKLELKPGVTEMVTGGRPHDDIRVLLRDLHEGVMELGVGNCEVLVHDKYQLLPPQFGFDLCQRDEEHHRVWEFMITLGDFSRWASMIHPALREALTTVQGRQRLARMFQAGLHPREIGDRLVDPAVVFIRRRLKELDEKAKQAQVEAQLQKNRGEVRRTLLAPDPATVHFFTQYEMSALEKIVADLELGKHL